MIYDFFIDSCNRCFPHFLKGRIEAQGTYVSLKSELASLSSSESNETADSLYEQEKSKSNQPENTESDKKLKVMSDEMKAKEKVR